MEKGTTGSPSFTLDNAQIKDLLDHLRTIGDLQSTIALSQWDQQTAMPVGAAEVRGYQLATLEGISHDLCTDERLGKLLDELQDKVGQAGFTDADRGLVRHARRIYDHATKLPRSLVEEMARVAAGSDDAWRQARANSDFEKFAPWLTRTVALQREVADRFGYSETRYDALLDEYELGLTARKVEQWFDPVRTVSTNLLKAIQASGNEVDSSCIKGNFPEEQQFALSNKALLAMGYDLKYGEVAKSTHPFTTSFGSPFDVRLTVRYDQHYLPTSLMAALHEGGHALYEQGSAPALVRTPLAGGASLGAHESQSRLWENSLGRSLPYWQKQYEMVKEVFPQQFSNVDVTTFVKALNRVQPSLIRVEADEVTYNLHILIRFELEKALINEDLAVESLPRLWNAKYREYLGVEPSRDAEGVLQDIHWTSGFGYFPTYTLGNLYGAQIFNKLHQEFPDFDERLASGDTSFVLQWLREHMYVYGAIYQPEELIQRVTGEAPNPAYFVNYLTEKFSAIYGL